MIMTPTLNHLLELELTESKIYQNDTSNILFQGYSYDVNKSIEKANKPMVLTWNMISGYLVSFSGKIKFEPKNEPTEKF